MCRVFNVSRSDFYAWLKTKPSKRVKEREILTKEILRAHGQNEGGYGSPKITVEPHEKVSQSEASQDHESKRDKKYDKYRKYISVKQAEHEQFR